MKILKSILIKKVEYYKNNIFVEKGTIIYSDGIGWYTDKSCKNGFLFGVYTFGTLECIEDNPFKEKAIKELKSSINNLKEGSIKESLKLRLVKLL